MSRQYMKSSIFRVSIAGMLVAMPLAMPSAPAGVASAQASKVDLDNDLRLSLGDDVSYAGLIGDMRGVSLLSAPQGSFNGFPTSGDTAMIISTGDASVVNDEAKGKLEDVIAGDQAGTDLDGAGSVDGNDLTRVQINVKHAPVVQPCITFDFMLLTEEYPKYVDQVYNDIFTAELEEFTDQLQLEGDYVLENGQVLAPFNYASGLEGELVSINTFTSFLEKPSGTTLNASSPVLSASVKARTEGDTSFIYLTVQDIGDSVLDTAVIVDNVRVEATCPVSPERLDSDGDGLSDEWEKNGIDFNRDGVLDVDLKAMGADPMRKDLFIELDWMLGDPRCKGVGDASKIPICGAQLFDPKYPSPPPSAADQHKTPQPEALAKVVQAFAEAPVDNPVGPDGITLHIDAGPTSVMRADGTLWGSLGRGNSVEFKEKIVPNLGNNRFDWTDLLKYKEANFDPARRDVFHYGVYGNWYGDTNSGGLADLPGSNFIVTFTFDPTATQEGQMLMHEFGHNLDLDHSRKEFPGSETNYQDQFRSVMSYCFGANGLDSPSGTLDYSRGNGDGVWPCAGAKRGAGTQQQDIDVDEWKKIEWLLRGPIGGAAGGPDPDPPSIEYEPLPFDEMKEAGTFAFDGDGSAVALGPDLFAAGVEGQAVLVQVYNPSAVESSYRIEIDETFSAGPVEVTVAPDSTERIEVPIRAGKTTNAPTPLTVSLFNGDTLLSSDIINVQALDLTRDEVAVEVQGILDQEEPESFDPAVVELLRADLEPVLSGEVVPDPSALEPNIADLAASGDAEDDGIPLGVIGALIGGLLLIVLVGAIALRKK